MPTVRTLDKELLTGIAPGTWVAISHDQLRVLATGESLDEVLKKARGSGEENPFIIRVPIENSALIV